MAHYSLLTQPCWVDDREYLTDLIMLAGWYGVSVRAACRRAGVNRGSLHYFVNAGRGLSVAKARRLARLIRKDIERAMKAGVQPVIKNFPFMDQLEDLMNL